MNGPKKITWFRWALSSLIVCFWGVMMGLLLVNDVFSRRNLGVEGFVAPDKWLKEWEDIDEWMNFQYKGELLGVVHTQIIKDSEYSFMAGSDARLRLPIGPIRPLLRANSTMVLDQLLTFQDARLDLEIFNQKIQVDAMMTTDAFFYRVLQSGRPTAAGRLVLAMPPSLYQMAQSLTIKEGFTEIGKNYAVPVFDPLWNFGGGVAMVSVVRKETIPWGPDREPIEVYVLITSYGSLKSTSWVDMEGRAIRQEIGRNFVFERTTREEALTRFPDMERELTVPELDRSAIRQEAERYRNRPANTGALNLLISGLEGAINSGAGL